MSTAVAPYPIVGALVAVERITGPGETIWTPVTEEQGHFLNSFSRDDLKLVPEIESLASYHADALNEFLASKGYTIKLNPWPAGTGFGAASTMDIGVEWLNTGTARTIRTDDGEYPAVRLHGSGVGFLSSPSFPGPIAKLTTRSGDEVYMAMPPQTMAFTHRMMSALVGISQSATRSDQHLGGVIFPMVSLDLTTPLSWLTGMVARGTRDHGSITQAVQQTRFKMNEKGAQSAVAISLIRSLGPPDLVFNRPFLVWISRPGLKLPLVAAYVTPEDWRNPGSL